MFKAIGLKIIGVQQQPSNELDWIAVKNEKVHSIVKQFSSGGNPIQKFSLKKTKFVLNSLTVLYLKLDHNNIIV